MNSAIEESVYVNGSVIVQLATAPLKSRTNLNYSRGLNSYHAVNTPSRLQKTNRLMLYTDMTVVYSEIHTENTNTLCGQT